MDQEPQQSPLGDGQVGIRITRGRRRITLDVDAVAAVTCPLQRGLIISNFARAKGTLSPVVARMRRDAIVEALAAGHTVLDIADAWQIEECNIHRLKAWTPPPASRRRSRFIPAVADA